MKSNLNGLSATPDATSREYITWKAWKNTNAGIKGASMMTRTKAKK
jgi:hypothetical protein